MSTNVTPWRRLYNRYPAEVISVYCHGYSWFAVIRTEQGAYISRKIDRWCKDDADAWLAARRQFAGEGRR